MKITFILLTAVALQVSAKGYTQTITLSVKNAPLEKVFESITKQSGYRFFYNEEQLQKSRPVTLTIREASVQDALNSCLKDQPLTYTIVQNVIVIKEKTGEQSINQQPEETPIFIDIKGRVLDEKGEPVAGATVTIKGTKIATSTNSNGEFSLSAVDDGAVLVFTSVNMEPFELKVDGKTEVTVAMKTKITTLSDVSVQVNTGYQIIPKERSTGSFVIIDNKTLNQQVSTDVLSRLEAVANGLYVDRISTTPGIRIRGLSTINGPKDPLVIVDNFPYEGDITNINPNDVENITILKDAAAASIWGTRAGNGVIVITTKKGKFNQPLSVEFNTNLKIANEPDLFNLKRMSSGEIIDVEQFLFQNKYDFSDTSNSNRPPFSPVYEILFSEMKGVITPAEAAAKINALRNTDVRNDFAKYFYQKAINQQYSIMLRGGAEKFAWIFSGGYDKNVDVLDANYKRLNVRWRSTMRPVKNLEIHAGMTYTNVESKKGKPGYSEISFYQGHLFQYAQLANTAGDRLPMIKDYRQTYIDTAGNGKLLDWRYYPLEDHKYVHSSSKLNDVLLNVCIEYKIVKGLSIDFKYQYENQQINGRTMQDENSYFVRNLINRYSQINQTTGLVTRIVPLGRILDLANTSLNSHSGRGQINYELKLLKHEINAIAGGEIRNRITTDNGNRLYGYNHDKLTFANMDYVTQYPNYISGTVSPIFNNDFIEGRENRYVYVFANAAYTYDQKYTVTVSARRDASNLFGVNTNDKWKPLWSTGLAWDISKEPFYKTSIFPYLRIRATYGYCGNVEPNRPAVTTIRYAGTSPFTNSPWAQFDNYYNPELTWETSAQFNIGLDFEIKNRILSGSIEYYRKKNTDLFGPKPLDYTTGITNITANVASMKGYGLDVGLNSRNIDRKIKWVTNLNFSYYKDRVTSYYLSSDQGSNFVEASNISGIEGKPVYSILSYRWAGLDPATGDPQGFFGGQVSKNYNELTGSLTTIDDLVYHGPGSPTFYGTLGNTVSWRNLSISVAITYRLGYYFHRESISYAGVFNSLAGHSDFAERWQKPGDEQLTNVPSMVYPLAASRDDFYRNSEALVTRADHVRLQYINVGYELNKSQWEQNPFKNIQVYFVANDLGIIWRANKQKIDPDFRILPPSTNFSIGVRTQF